MRGIEESRAIDAALARQAAAQRTRAQKARLARARKVRKLVRRLLVHWNGHVDDLGREVIEELIAAAESGR
jgi:hypothetical protein